MVKQARDPPCLVDLRLDCAVGERVLVHPYRIGGDVAPTIDDDRPECRNGRDGVQLTLALDDVVAVIAMSSAG